MRRRGAGQQAPSLVGDLPESSTRTRLARFIIRRDGSLLPRYANARIVHLEDHDDHLGLQRSADDPEKFSFDVLDQMDELAPSESSVTIIVASGEEKRSLTLFETAELLVADANRRFSVKRLGDAGVRNFAACAAKHFWSEVNPYLEVPFVDPSESAFSPLRFRSTQCSASSLERVCLLLIRLFVQEDDDEAGILIRCATRVSAASGSLWLPDPKAVDPRVRLRTTELIERIVVAYAPFSEGLRSSDPDVGAWVSPEDAVWVGDTLDFYGPRAHRLPAIERAELIGRLRRELLEVGVPCNDIFDEVSTL